MRIFEVGTVFGATGGRLRWKITGINYDDRTYAWEYITKDGHARNWKWENAEEALANREIELVSVPLTKLERPITVVQERYKHVHIGGFSFSYSEIELAEPRKLHKRYLRGI
jgi:hypothetical protein